MPKIILFTEIDSKIDICFDLSRSIDLHQISTAKTHEKAISGKTSGLISLGEFVTWEATHFGLRQKLSSRITAYERPNYFIDEQVEGPFKSFRHNHTFEAINGKVSMKDEFVFESPFGLFGKLFNWLVLTRYLKHLLMARNQVIKEYAETEQWKLILSEA